MQRVIRRERAALQLADLQRVGPDIRLLVLFGSMVKGSARAGPT